MRYGYPQIGGAVRCRVLRASSTQATLSIVEADGKPTIIAYKAILKGTGFAEEIYLCDKMKYGDMIDATVLSYGDGCIFVSQ